MKPLIEEIQDILTPKNNVGMVAEEKIYQLQPIMPLSEILELGNDLTIDGQQKLIDLLFDKNTVIFNGIVYFANYGLNFFGRLQEIFAVYNEYIRDVVGDKEALIKLYDTIPVEDIANLVENHVIFAMKNLPFEKTKKKTLAAIRYLPEYEIHYERRTYVMPACTLGIRIDNNLNIDHPEVISDGFKYQHPFVYTGHHQLGQKICMGSFYNSKEKNLFNKLRFANNINQLLKQAVQILVAGYNRNVTPANGHLTDRKYDIYLKKDN